MRQTAGAEPCACGYGSMILADQSYNQGGRGHWTGNCFTTQRIFITFCYGFVQMDKECTWIL